MGLPDHQIEMFWVGEKFAFGDNGTAEGRALNRRVDLVISGPEGAFNQKPESGNVVDQGNESQQSQPVAR
jgi:hypothetical protein